jgi:hypothetical protein
MRMRPVRIFRPGMILMSMRSLGMRLTMLPMATWTATVGMVRIHARASLKTTPSRFSPRIGPRRRVGPQIIVRFSGSLYIGAIKGENASKGRLWARY